MTVATTTPAQPNPLKKTNWINILVLGLTPPLALALSIIYIRQSGFQATDLIPFVVMYMASGLAITAGYHRYYAHRAYDAHPFVQWYFLLFGASALQNSANFWVADHRRHHRHVDHEADPYNIHKGFFWAHMGWIFFDEGPTIRTLNNIPDLDKDGRVKFQQRFYVPIAAIIGLGVPFLIGLCFGRPFGGMLFGGLVRLVFVHHCTFLINSAAHYFGTRPYSEKTSARDSWWLAFFSYGEGYHNFHHTFPSDYRNGIAWFHWDPTKWMIATFSKLGLADKLRVTSEKTILATRASQGTAKTRAKVADLAQSQGAVASAAADPFTHGAESQLAQLSAGVASVVTL